MVETYSSIEFRKLIMEEDKSVPWVKTTFIGATEYKSDLNPDGYDDPTDTGRAIWKIKKMVETTVWTTKTTETLFPVGDARESFVRDHRDDWTYTYI